MLNQEGDDKLKAHQNRTLTDWRLWEKRLDFSCIQFAGWQFGSNNGSTFIYCAFISHMGDTFFANFGLSITASLDVAAEHFHPLYGHTVSICLREHSAASAPCQKNQMITNRVSWKWWVFSTSYHQISIRQSTFRMCITFQVCIQQSGVRLLSCQHRPKPEEFFWHLVSKWFF